MGSGPHAGTPLATRAQFSTQDTYIVLLYMTGQFTQAALAEKFGHKEDYINRILNSTQAEEVREAARKKVAKELVDQTQDEIPELLSLSVRALRRTLEADIPPRHKAKANQDRVALRLLEGYGIIGQADNGGGRPIQMPPELYEGLVEAMTKSNRVREIMAIPETEAEVVEV